MAFSKYDKKIKSLLDERNNNPLTNKEITKIRGKTALLDHLMANKKNIAYFKFNPQADYVTFTTKHGIDDWDSIDIEDVVNDFKFTGYWERGNR